MMGTGVGPDLRGRAAGWLALVLLLSSARLMGQVSVWTWRYDNTRVGVNGLERTLNPANVNSQQFGRLFSQPVDGEIYAQPLYLPNLWIPGKGTHNVVFVATEHDSVYAFDADDDQGSNSAPLWHVSFIDPPMGIRPVTSDDLRCTDIKPEVGITGTPVIDTATGTLYLVARTWENGHAVQRLHALDVATGQEKYGSPISISATVDGMGTDSNAGQVSFDPLMENQRTGLLLDHGVVYISWASTCDRPPWHGWVMAYDASSLRQLAVFNSTPDGFGGGFWQAGAAPAADADGNVYLENANGTLDAEQGGRDYSSVILRLHLSGNQLTPQDQFIPFNADYMNASNEEPSSGVILLPPQGDGVPPLALGSSKLGSLYLLNRNQFGGFHAGSDSQIVQWMQNVSSGIDSTPAYWNGFLYLIGGGEYSSPDHLKMFALRQGRLSSSPVASDSTPIDFPGASPVISANGNNDGIVWALRSDGWKSGGPAILSAWDAQTLQPLYSSDTNSARDNPGAAVKFTVPVVANGKVYVGTHDRLSVYGLLVNDFSVSLSPSDQRIDAGDSATLVVTTTSSGAPVRLHCDQPASCNVAPATLPKGGSATVTVDPASLPEGQQNVVVSADNGVFQHQASATVRVQDFALWLPSNQGMVQSGHSIQTSVHLTSQSGYDAQATLTCDQPPAGIHCAFDPPGVNSGDNASTVNLSADADVSSGSYPVSVVATHGGLRHAATYTLQVVDYQLQAASESVTATPQDAAQVAIQAVGPASSREAIQLSCGPSHGAACNFQPAVIHPGESSLLTVSHLDAAGVGVWQIPVIGSVQAGASTLAAQASVTFNVVDFAVTPDFASQVIDRGQKSAQFTLTTQSQSGMKQPVNLSCSVPAPAVCALAPQQVVPGQNSVLTVSGLDQITAPSVNVTVQASFGNDHHDLALAVGFRDFGLDPLQSSATIQPGTDTVALSIAIASVNGYSRPIQLSCANPQVHCTFDPAIVNPGDKSTATISGLSAIQGNSLKLAIAGASSDVVHQTQVEILIGDFALSEPSYGGEVTAGQSAQFPITLTSYNQFQGSVQLSCSGAPRNATCALSPATVSLPGNGTVQTTLQVTTMARTVLPPPPDRSGSWNLWLWLAGIGLLLSSLRRRWRPLLGVGLLLAMSAACGDAGKMRGTPAGSTTLTVTATSGPVQRVLPFTLTVK